MRTAASLLLLFASVLVVRMTMAGDSVADLRGAALAFGFALIAAALVGTLFERIRLPRISGYLFFGLACGPYAADLISRSMAADLQLVNGLAIALIAFIAGLEMNLARLSQDLKRIAGLSFAVLVGPFVLFAVAFAVGWPWLPLPPIDSVPLRLAVCCVMALLVVSFSPTVAIAVIAESRARGPLTSLVVALVVFADLALIIVFSVLLQLVRLLAGGDHPSDVGVLALLSWEIIGALAFGAALGAVFAMYLRIVGREITLALLGLCVLLAIVGRAFNFEVVLASLAAGLVVENIAPPRGDALKLAVERGALPVLVVFFAAAGASLELSALARVGAAALVIGGSRAALLYFANRAWLRRSSQDDPARLAWMGLVSQGGVTLGLASLVAAEFAAWGEPLYTLVLSLVALNILVGPIMFGTALARAGEVGRME